MTYRAPVLDAPLLVISTHVVALDRTTGHVRWTYDVDEPTRRFAIEGARLFVFDAKSNLHCLDVATGALLGKVELELYGANTMLVDGDRLYVTGEREVAALDLNGRLLWKSNIPFNGAHSLCGLAVVGGNVMQPDYSTRP